MTVWRLRNCTSSQTDQLAGFSESRPTASAGISNEVGILSVASEHTSSSQWRRHHGLVDETYMGGKRKNMPKSKREEMSGRGAVGKTAVVGAKDRATKHRPLGPPPVALPPLPRGQGYDGSSCLQGQAEDHGAERVSKKPELPVVDLPEETYQPSVAELREPIRLPGTFEDAIKALVSPVKVRRIPIRKWRSRK